jgi:hypothetical protein
MPASRGRSESALGAAASCQGRGEASVMPGGGPGARVGSGGA